MDSAIDQSRKLAELLNGAGIEVAELYQIDTVGLVTDSVIKNVWRILFLPKRNEVPLTENLMVLMDAWVKLGGHFKAEEHIVIVMFEALHKPTISIPKACNADNWESALCAALVESLFKKLGE